MKADGVTGDERLSFINSAHAMLPNGKKGADLFRYLRTLTSSNGDNRRDVVATVFCGVQNRMITQLATDILQQEKRIAKIMGNNQRLLAKHGA